MEYNGDNLKLNNDSIIMSNGEEVMMSWEHPLMYKHAETCSKSGGDILEIGFGMGISADYIQSFNVKSHTIVESHPQILEKLYEWSRNKPNVRIIEGDWFSKIDEILKYSYDGIFFDTHRDVNRLNFKNLVVDKCIRTGGVFTWFEPRGVNTYNCGFKVVDVEVNPVDCSYYSDTIAKCPFIEY